jgi:transcriptional regulator with XRE-family HTH domain
MERKKGMYAMEREHRKLAEARYRKGWSQEQVAESVGIARSTISQWERGVQTPQEFYVHRLCDFYQMTREELGLEELARCKPRSTTKTPTSDTLSSLRTEATGKPELQEARELPITPSQPEDIVAPGTLTLNASELIAASTTKQEPQLQHLLENDKAVDRREAVKTISSLGLAFLTRSDVLLNTQPLEQHSVLADLPGFDETTPETLPHFATLTETCRHLSEGNELAIAERILWTYLPKVEALALLSFEQQPLAAAIVSQGYVLAASLAGHRNNLRERLHYSEQALLYGKLAQDRNLQVVALRQVAISFDCMRQPGNVLHTYQRAFPHLDDISPLLRACIYADISGAHAQLGHEQDAYRFMGMAYEHFPQYPEQEPLYLRTICRHSSLIFWDALNHLLLQQPLKTEKIFERIDGLHPNSQNPERNRAEVLNYQVETFMALRKMDQACTYLETAVKAAKAVGSVRRFQETCTLFQQMNNLWRHEQQVQQLADLFVG